MTVLAEKIAVGGVRIAINVDAVGQEINAADIDGDAAAVVQVALQHLAVPGGGGVASAPGIFTGPGDGRSGGVSVVILQVLGRGLGSSAELIPVGAGNGFKPGAGRIGHGAVWFVGTKIDADAFSGSLGLGGESSEEGGCHKPRC